MTEQDQPTETGLLRSNLASAVFSQLAGTWSLERLLQSTNAAEPSGRCTGAATFTLREPSVFVDKDGKLQTAVGELLYHEQGEFEMQQSLVGSVNVPRFPFSRRYVWRLQEQEGANAAALTVWFTKPGTDVIDYVFHKIDVQSDSLASAFTAGSGRCVEGSGGHLCEQDFYSSVYSFQLDLVPEETAHSLRNWSVIHEVRGPQKDQVIESKYTKS